MNGIGGRTIAEAKERMSIQEYDIWRQYRQRHGGLNVALRIERGSALVAWAAGGRIGSIDDYMPYRTDADGSQQLRKAMSEWR